MGVFISNSADASQFGEHASRLSHGLCHGVSRPPPPCSRTPQAPHPPHLHRPLPQSPPQLNHNTSAPQRCLRHRTHRPHRPAPRAACPPSLGRQRAHRLVKELPWPFQRALCQPDFRYFAGPHRPIRRRNQAWCVFYSPSPFVQSYPRADGLIYLPEIKYRRILNKAFGPGGWGLAPRSETNVGPKVVSREYALVCLGRSVLSDSIPT